ncbi:uncharacterized protein MYCFIDRAFT_212567 [Pseudocercospora fijiensis CIRAD86]|uniref:Uncharacterized protein n=1 Tax=Pseudocercospora fijiensis (strain CIRAD86) TaxID=383855 RepID=M3AL03_PSEFD|nr:uncharacterized protein MYCFIDRAFT_212567 [Pseudocercospora fijiensis CIRAD86]EME77823.1 hypothetical protein MYCFIDRAFT_212567 [Pseudocercospora fijiensis CIRAD86]
MCGDLISGLVGQCRSCLVHRVSDVECHSYRSSQSECKHPKNRMASYMWNKRLLLPTDHEILGLWPERGLEHSAIPCFPNEVNLE